MADLGADRDLKAELGRVVAAVDGVARIEPTLRSALAAVASGVASGVAAGAGRILPGQPTAPPASAPALGIDIDTRPGGTEDASRPGGPSDHLLTGLDPLDRIGASEQVVLTDVTVDIATWPSTAAVVVARDARAAVRTALLGRGRHPGHLVINVMDVLPAGPGQQGPVDS